jgi:excisionase family DNA binding protein
MTDADEIEPRSGDSTPKGTITMSDKMAYSVQEAAEQLGIGRTLAYELIREGRLPSIKLGNRRLVPHSDLVAFLEDLPRAIRAA